MDIHAQLWPNEQATASVMLPPASRLMASATSSPLSRTATSASTGMSQARDGRLDLAARLARRGLGLAVSRTRQTCSSVGRVGAIAFIGILIGSGPGAVLKCPAPVARK